MSKLLKKLHNKTIDIHEANKLIIKLKDELNDKFDQDYINQYIKSIFDFKIIINNIPYPTNNKIIVPKEFIKLEKHYQKLANTPQPDQRTPEWFKFRSDRITASNIADALDHNPYSSWENFIITKCTPDIVFKDNDTVFHGKKHEEVATKIYQEIFNVKVEEFGCLPHPTIPFLGASPDGICSKETLDGKFSDRLGVMLEIKCPTRRKIYHEGDIMGHICPHYYWYQCQVQMECCELDKCDFWQCEIEEITFQEYINNEFDKYYTQGIDAQTLNVPDTCHQGVIIQLLPKNYVPRYPEDKHYFQGKIIYPDRLNYNFIQYQQWILQQLETLHKYPDFYFDKVIYWRLKSCHNVEIIRDKKWFADNLPILQDTWNKVLYYRNHPKKLKKLEKIVEKKKNVWKFNTKFTISKQHNDIKFLELDIDSDNDSISNSDIDFID